MILSLKFERRRSIRRTWELHYRSLEGYSPHCLPVSKLTIRIRCSPNAILAGLCGSSSGDGVSTTGSSFMDTSSSDTAGATSSAGFVFGGIVAFVTWKLRLAHENVIDIWKNLRFAYNVKTRTRNGTTKDLEEVLYVGEKNFRNIARAPTSIYCNYPNLKALIFRHFASNSLIFM
jgi:hypothetical protein